jgi:hypothetical protein
MLAVVVEENKVRLERTTTATTALAGEHKNNRRGMSKQKERGAHTRHRSERTRGTQTSKKNANAARWREEVAPRGLANNAQHDNAFQALFSTVAQRRNLRNTGGSDRSDRYYIVIDLVQPYWNVVDFFCTLAHLMFFFSFRRRSAAIVRGASRNSIPQFT